MCLLKLLRFNSEETNEVIRVLWEDVMVVKVLKEVEFEFNFKIYQVLEKSSLF